MSRFLNGERETTEGEETRWAREPRTIAWSSSSSAAPPLAEGGVGAVADGRREERDGLREPRVSGICEDREGSSDGGRAGRRRGVEAAMRSYAARSLSRSGKCDAPSASANRILAPLAWSMPCVSA